MKWPNHKASLLNERDNLVDKIDRLRAFVKSDDFSLLPVDEKRRLVRQHDAMREYANVLNERIRGLPL